MKSRHSKYSCALSIHSDVRTKTWRLRRIPTSLHRCMLTNHVVFLLHERSLHNCSLTWHSATLVTHTLTTDFSDLWKHCYRFTHAAFH